MRGLRFRIFCRLRGGDGVPAENAEEFLRVVRVFAGDDQAEITVFRVGVFSEAGELVLRDSVKMGFPGFRFPAPAALQVDAGAVKQGKQLRIVFQRDQGAAGRVIQEFLPG